MLLLFAVKRYLELSCTLKLLIICPKRLSKGLRNRYARPINNIGKIYAQSDTTVHLRKLIFAARARYVR